MENGRRQFIKNGGLALGAIPTFQILSKGSHFSAISKDEDIIGHGDYKYKVHKNWAQLHPIHSPLLNCHEMVMDSKGRLIMIGDHTQNNIMVFDKSGKLIDSWGSGFPGGHGISINDEGGEDFLYIVDSGYYIKKDGTYGKQAGQVVKTDVTGRLIFNLPHPYSLGIYTSEMPYMPTEVTVAPNGDIYVADGYGSDYIIQFDQKGQYIRHFGGHDNSDELHNLKNAHGVAIDTRGANPLVICTSRTENCFKYFTLDGKFVKKVDMPGLYVCRPVMDDNNLYAGVCWSKTREENKGWVPNTGFITIMQGDQVVSNPGGTAPKYENGILQQMYQSENPIFAHGHDVCVDEDKNLYVCQWNANKTAPIKLERV